MLLFKTEEMEAQREIDDQFMALEQQIIIGVINKVLHMTPDQLAPLNV